MIDFVEKKFDKNCAFNKHLLVNDPYFTISIIKRIDWIKKKYESYMSSTDFEQLKKDIFYIILVMYSIDSHHYFHVDNKGKNFKSILVDCDKLFNHIYKYVKNKKSLEKSRDSKLKLYSTRNLRYSNPLLSLNR